MPRLRPAIVVLAVSAVALAASAAVLASAAPDHVENVGSRVIQPPSVAGKSASPGTQESTLESSGKASPSSATPRFPGTRTDATKPIVREQVASPVRIVIPDIGVDAPIDAIGVDDKGRVAVPADVQRIGWYKWNPAPGASTGSAVLAGHVDGVDQGPGAFYALKELEVGARIRIERDDASTLTYRVIARESFAKSQVPLDEVFARSGPHLLTLITCGGPFDYDSLGYTDNIIVTAVPE